jgi:hypothetical protein
MTQIALFPEDERKPLRICECCGAKIVEYKHSFSKALAVGLGRLHFFAGGPVNLKNLGLTRNQWDNFQKLRYWGLVNKATKADGTRAGGEWFLTKKGVDFIEKGIGITKSVWTYRGEAVRFEGDTCFYLDDHEPKYKRRKKYAQESKPHEGET